MDDCDRASITEEQHREAALAALRAERARAARHYRPADQDTCEECGSALDPCRRGWTTVCVSCARDRERWSNR